jgi:hypothetical protein
VTRRLSEELRDAAALTCWEAVEIGGRVHLVGVLLGGHDRLPAGAWIVTSDVRRLDLATRAAITASTGRRYTLGMRLAEPLPDAALGVMARAMRAWGIDGAPPSEALADAEIVRKLEQSQSSTRPANPIEPARGDDRSDGKGRS